MATIHVCDKCGSHNNTMSTDLATVKIPHLNSELDSTDFFQRELCRTCLRQLVEWVNKPNTKFV